MEGELRKWTFRILPKDQQTMPPALLTLSLVILNATETLERQFSID